MDSHIIDPVDLEIDDNTLTRVWDQGWVEIPVPLKVGDLAEVMLSFAGFGGAWCGRWRFAGVRMERNKHV